MVRSLLGNLNILCGGGTIIMLYYFDIPDGKAMFSFNSHNLFDYVQLVYFDFDGHVFNLTRGEIIGKSTARLYKEFAHAKSIALDSRKNLLKLATTIIQDPESPYTPNDLLSVLNSTDKEIVRICSLPVVEGSSKYVDTCHMRFKLPNGGIILFNLNQGIGFTSLHVKYTDGYTYDLVRSQLFYKSEAEVDKEADEVLNKTAMKREDFKHIINLVSESNTPETVALLVDTLKDGDPCICNLCDIS